MIGQTFARLTVISRAGRDRHRRALWHCRCSCGKAKILAGIDLRKGAIKSCGCLRDEHARRMARDVLLPFAFRTKHNDSRSSEHMCWGSMIQRCLNPKHRAYARYGGRGITVCDRWRHSYENFLADMGRRPTPKHSLDRIDNDLGYSPDNCRWTSAKRQMRNRATNLQITYGAVIRPLAEWSDVTGLPRTTISNRLIRGWTIGQALGFEPRP